MFPTISFALPSIEENPLSCEQGISLLRASGASFVDTIPWDVVGVFIPIPSHLMPLSPVCAFVQDEGSESTFTFEHESTPYRPRVYRWKTSTIEWKPLETKMNRATNTVSVSLKGNKGIIGVFVDTRDAYEGIASWYRHGRYPAGAATNIYPIGTKLRVTNLDTKKSTDVTVTSTWTNIDKRRIIDLVSTAFKKIASLSQGLIPIRMERL